METLKPDCSFEDNSMSHKTATGSECECRAFPACSEILDSMPRIKGGGREGELPEAAHKVSTTKDSYRKG